MGLRTCTVMWCSLGSPALATSWDYVHALPRGVHLSPCSPALVTKWDYIHALPRGVHSRLVVLDFLTSWGLDTCMEHYVVWLLAVAGDADACTYDRVLVES